MQLKKLQKPIANSANKKALKGLLTTATCALLGVHGNVEAKTDLLTDWKFDTALMLYSEPNRVSAGEAIIAGTKTFSNDDILNLKVTVDSLTGASANGAVAQPNPQTFTGPSGEKGYHVDANTTPLDNTFKDLRVQANAQWTQPLSNNYTWSIGGNLSKEFDYLSIGTNTNIAKDFNNKNTTLSAGFALYYDVINPVGGIAKPLSPMLYPDQFTRSFKGEDDENSGSSSKVTIGNNDNKTTTDLLLGLTQVISRRMIMQFNYSFSTVNGYLTDPYKFLSSVNDNGLTQQYLYENRPNNRTKHAFFVQTKYHFDNSIIDASYRYMTDDWHVNSHTVDLRYRINLSKGNYIEPHVRYYTQTAADFYQPFLQEGAILPEFASSDYRVGEMDTYTLGIKYGMPLANDKSMAFRVEYYHQTPKNAGFSQPGVLAEQNLYENIDAVIAQASYSF